MKQMIVMRKDLGMSAGKMVAQGAHASLGGVLPYVQFSSWDDPEDVHRQKCIREWLAGSFTKVCVRVESEEELFTVVKAARLAGITNCVITDSGKTEFNGVPTVTCAAIGPDSDENLAPITGHLKLL